MTTVSRHPPGEFCWVELATTDAAAAKNFYASLFGWSATDTPMGPDGVYSMLALDGRDVGALFELTEPLLEAGVEPHWLSYLSVSSADDVAERTPASGGRVVREPFDVMDAGRMAVIEDPAGASLAVWQPGTHAGYRVVRESGSVGWTELATPDPAAVQPFYVSLFGWTVRSERINGVPYCEFRSDGQAVAGMYRARPGESRPAGWMPYFQVAHCDDKTSRARALGGRVLDSPADVGSIGRYAVLADPAGAAFSIIRLFRAAA